MKSCGDVTGGRRNWQRSDQKGGIRDQDVFRWFLGNIVAILETIYEIHDICDKKVSDPYEMGPNNTHLTN